MWLLNAESLLLESFEGDKIPPYAILSHRWENDEVSFKDVQKARADALRGFSKVQKCCQQALSDGLSYVWIDTCCIDKRSSAELSEAINSMFRWYREAKVCYAFLSDVVSEEYETTEVDTPKRHYRLTESLWFTRGWTLQELLAPSTLLFFDHSWRCVGSKLDHAIAIETRTKIPKATLRAFDPHRHCIAQKLSWASERQTSRVEDQTYSLLGLFEVNMPLLYGEGENAFLRFQEELIRISHDASIFIFDEKPHAQCAMLASSPASFRNNAVVCSPDLCRENFSASKDGVTGSFKMHHYALDVYAIQFGHITAPNPVDDHATYVVLFLRWNFLAARFQRVELDGMLLEVVGPVFNEQVIKIGRLPIEKVTSTHLPWDRLSSYGLTQPVKGDFYGFDFRLIPGMFYEWTGLNIRLVPNTILTRELPDGPIDSLPFWNFGRDCVCVFGKYRGPIRKYRPLIMLRPAVNCAQKPVLLLSLIDGAEEEFTGASIGKQRSCQFGGHCCYLDAPQLTSVDGVAQDSSSLVKMLLNRLKSLYSVGYHRLDTPVVSEIPEYTGLILDDTLHRVNLGDWIEFQFFERWYKSVALRAPQAMFDMSPRCPASRPAFDIWTRQIPRGWLVPPGVSSTIAEAVSEPE